MNERENRWSPEARPERTEPPESAVAHSARGTAHSAPTSSSSETAGLPETQSLELSAICGAGTAFHGSLSFSGRVRIDGQFEGSAFGGELLVIGDGADVSGELRARRVIVLGGRVNAEISATESIELHIPAVVTGDLKSPQIYMDRGIQFHGTCDMTVDPPQVESKE